MLNFYIGILNGINIIVVKEGVVGFYKGIILLWSR